MARANRHYIPGYVWHLLPGAENRLHVFMRLSDSKWPNIHRPFVSLTWVTECAEKSVFSFAGRWRQMKTSSPAFWRDVNCPQGWAFFPDHHLPCGMEKHRKSTGVTGVRPTHLTKRQGKSTGVRGPWGRPWLLWLNRGAESLSDTNISGHPKISLSCK